MFVPEYLSVLYGVLSRLKKSRFGCNVGVVGISYVDNLSLFALTRYLLQKIIHMCDVCRIPNRFFNGTTRKLMVYGMDVNDSICVCMCGENVECVNRIDYFGHSSITNDRSNSLVNAVLKNFNITFNSLIKNTLFKYCTNYYGLNMWFVCCERNEETLY